MNLRRKRKTVMIPVFGDVSDDPKMIEVEVSEIPRVLAWRIHRCTQEIYDLQRESANTP